MTAEDAFHAALDADPSDAITRLVFADWLEERGDPRAEGYRALGVLGLHPRRLVVARWDEHDTRAGTVRDMGGYYTYHLAWTWDERAAVHPPHHLPVDWVDWLYGRDPMTATRIVAHHDTRRAAEDAAALAFARLPRARRAELLAGGLARV